MSNFSYQFTVFICILKDFFGNLRGKLPMQSGLGGMDGESRFPGVELGMRMLAQHQR